METGLHRQGGSGHYTGRWHREDTHGSHGQLREYCALFSSEEVINMLIGNKSISLPNPVSLEESLWYPLDALVSNVLNQSLQMTTFE